MVFVDQNVYQDSGDCGIIRRQVLDVLPADEVHAAGLEFDGDRAGRADRDVLGVDLGTPITSSPDKVYKGQGWSGWNDWLGNGYDPRKKRTS